LFLGKNLVFVPECHSTNSLLNELVQMAQTSEGTLVITANQTRGRGQRGNVWETVANQNLTFSFLLRPTFLDVGKQFRLTVAVSLAISDFLTDRILDEVKIKWPNDLVVNGKKMAGILIENVLAGNQLQHSVVGIGLNVNQTHFAIGSATSMQLVANKEFDLNSELNGLLEKLERRYLQLRAGKFADLERDYLNILFRKGQEHLFLIEGETLPGVIEGVDEIGKLKVTISGRVRAFGLKEIQFVE